MRWEGKTRKEKWRQEKRREEKWREDKRKEKKKWLEKGRAEQTRADDEDISMQVTISWKRKTESVRERGIERERAWETEALKEL